VDEAIARLSAELAASRQDIDRLRTTVTELQTLAKALEEQVRHLTESLGG
jgi:uncharacterized coiled-coil protein SlyX